MFLVYVAVSAILMNNVNCFNVDSKLYIDELKMLDTLYLETLNRKIEHSCPCNLQPIQLIRDVVVDEKTRKEDFHPNVAHMIQILGMRKSFIMNFEHDHSKFTRDAHRSVQKILKLNFMVLDSLSLEIINNYQIMALYLNGTETFSKKKNYCCCVTCKDIFMYKIASINSKVEEYINLFVQNVKFLAVIATVTEVDQHNSLPGQ